MALQTLTGDTGAAAGTSATNPTGNTGATDQSSGVFYDMEGNPIDLAGNINTLLTQIQASGFDRAARLQDQFLELGANVDPSSLTGTERQALDDIKFSISQVSDDDRNQAIALLTHRGFGRSTDVAETFGGYAQKKLLGIAAAEAGYLTETAAQKRTQQTSFYDMAASIQSEIMRGNIDYARTLLDARNAEVNTQLSADQLALQRDIFEENAWLGRSKFTEEQKQNLIANGFTEQDIAMREQNMAFEMDMRQKEFTADTTLAMKNFGLQEKVQLGTLALSEIKNNHDMSIETRAMQLSEAVQLGTLGLETEKFELYAKQLEREFGLDVNRYELAKFIETGKLTAEIVNSQRAYDLQDEKQKQEFMLSKAALQLQETLGFREQDIKYALGQGSITVEHEANLIRAWAESNRLRYDYYALEEQIKANRDAGRSSILGGIISTVVRLGANWIFPGAGEVGKQFIDQTND